jgi:hypothetical protein
MGVMADGALLRSGVVRDHDLTLLRGPARQPFMTESAKLSRIGGNDHLHVLRVIRAGGRRPEHIANIARATGTVADLALDDLAEVGAVVDTGGPYCELLRMARRAVRRAFVLRFVGSYLRNRASSIVPVLVKRIDGEEFLRSIRKYNETDQYEDKSNDVSRHGVPNAGVIRLVSVFGWHA